MVRPPQAAVGPAAADLGRAFRSSSQPGQLRDAGRAGGRPGQGCRGRDGRQRRHGLLQIIGDAWLSLINRLEELRVVKECIIMFRSRWSTYQLKTHIYLSLLNL